MQKIANLQKINFFFQNPIIYNKNVRKKNVQKMMNYTFLKALDHAISNMQKFVKILNNLMCN